MWVGGRGEVGSGEGKKYREKDGSGDSKDPKSHRGNWKERRAGGMDDAQPCGRSVLLEVCEGGRSHSNSAGVCEGRGYHPLDLLVHCPQGLSAVVEVFKVGQEGGQVIPAVQKKENYAGQLQSQKKQRISGVSGHGEIEGEPCKLGGWQPSSQGREMIERVKP